jgi:hypothetical protein
MHVAPKQYHFIIGMLLLYREIGQIFMEFGSGEILYIDITAIG